jgi:uncharacterized protein (TIGR02391 family)
MTAPPPQRILTGEQIRAIADALGDTELGLTGSEITHLLATCQITDTDPTATKRHRLYNAFAEDQNRRHHRRNILEFIRQSTQPARYVRESHRFEPMRVNLNRALAFSGLQVSDAGELTSAKRARTLPEAERRAQELRTDLAARGVHSDVLRFCSAELLADNYFHAVMEAVKSVADKIRSRTGLTDDGDDLVTRALSGDIPMIAINALKTKSERSEQSGFANLLRGTFGMFRNTTAHEARINWDMAKEDAEDLLSCCPSFIAAWIRPTCRRACERTRYSLYWFSPSSSSRSSFWPFFRRRTPAANSL